ncbi:MAG TPA: ATPase, T2SS/T4P/T4SS family, partial [Isosphaeraceae bacterium]|nr:ATPase, T2SS/T4P/T4SS family [Isosphaeraceae bacterium]
LPPVMGEIASHDQGIVILAGVTGSGKSTTIAAMLNYVNTRERCHIVTIEDPIEFTFKDDKCIINQREVGIDVIDWNTALKHSVTRPGHYPGRRNARPRDVQRRHARRRNRPPRVWNDPRLERSVDD